MGKFRQPLSKLLICSTLFVGCAFAQTGLTPILDTVYNADKSTFNGTLIISWSGFTGSSGSTIAPHSTATHILNGALSVSLVPTTTASACAYYLATYNSDDGTVTWSETWQVPPSTTPVNLNTVRQPEDCDSDVLGSGGRGDITIAEVIGLTSDLSAINASLTSFTDSLAGLTTTVAGNSSGISGLTISLANLNTTVAGLSSSVATLTSIVNGLTSGSNAVFVDDETPSGAVNGTNLAFKLANAPLPASSLTLFSNGILLGAADFTLTTDAILFSNSSVPQTGDVLQAYYRLAGTGPTFKFSDDELPSGTIDGKNLVFTLADPPNPSPSLKLYKNGVLLRENTDYTLSAGTITFLSTSITPQPGDSLIAYYRY